MLRCSRLPSRRILITLGVVLVLLGAAGTARGQQADLVIIGFKPVIPNEFVVCQPTANVTTYRTIVTVKNVGSGTANPAKSWVYPFVVVYHKGNEVAKSHALQDSIAPGGLANTQETWIPAPKGPPPYQFVAKVDPSGKIAEQNDNNNTYSFTITQDAHAVCKVTLKGPQTYKPIPGGPIVPKRSP